MTAWMKIKDDREKYAAYLCSREWCEKREAVRERSGGVCERCGKNPMDACHHLTYARKYKERLEDLQAICNPCHEFTHGKSNVDPKTEPSNKFECYLVTLKELHGDIFRPVDFHIMRDGALAKNYNATHCVLDFLWNQWVLALKCKNALRVDELCGDQTLALLDDELTKLNKIAWIVQRHDTLGPVRDYLVWLAHYSPKVDSFEEYQLSLGKYGYEVYDWEATDGDVPNR